MLYYCMMLKKSHLSYKTRNCNTAGEERKPLWFYTYYSKGKSKNGEPRGCKIIWIFSSRTKLRNICGDKFISCSLETSAPKLSVVADKKMKIGEDCQNPSSSFKKIEVTKIEWSDRKRCEINHSSNIRERANTKWRNAFGNRLRSSSCNNVGIAWVWHPKWISRPL